LDDAVVYKTIKVAAGDATREVMKSAAFQADLASTFFKASTFESRLSASVKKGMGESMTAEKKKLMREVKHDFLDTAKTTLKPLSDKAQVTKMFEHPPFSCFSFGCVIF